MPRADKTIVVYRGQEYVKYSGCKYYSNRTHQHDMQLHRKIYTDAHGEIPKGYHVHHIDGDTDNNSIDNLIAIPHGAHTKETLKQRWEKSTKKKCISCGKQFESISNKAFFCSKTCTHREWRRKNSERVNSWYKNWRNENKDKISKYNKTQKERRRLLNATSR